ncbi:GGDEF domain-containing protein [Colwellia ponticola]|uniref:diguanylate cyclase n=1 Tax=Colwellia ponticola TaxID=2304625 RepID=A0A8H2PL66_9GAMM|nr:GGDEF domain-containing protein [Colwellia ponticola]TMM47503.1 GGDEF domain-containing protein [Colwellia ponticola]
MKLTGQRQLIILFIQWLLVTTCLANEPVNKADKLLLSVNTTANKNTVPPLTVINKLPINAQLLPLITELNKTNINHQQIDIALAQFTLSKVLLNAAEQYLLLVAQALLKESLFNQNNHSSEVIDSAESSEHNAQIIMLLQQADKLSEQISIEQLAQPAFLQLHLLLSEHYARQQQYDLAYLEQKAYLKKYNIYRKNKRLNMIESLEQSFEVQSKKANNILMENQNELKERRVVEVQKEKSSQQYNFILIICTAILFLLLFYRQLRVRNKLLTLTKTDDLTGLANRSALFEQGEQMVNNFTHQPEELSVLLIDVDHFKQLNDKVGHHLGDSALVVVSQLMKETMRSRDFLARLAGDKFVALLPFADCNKAKAIAMHINKKIAHYDFSSLMLPNTITISIGVITMNDKQISFDDLLHGADLTMYQAKAQGRNSVVCYKNIVASQERRVK